MKQYWNNLQARERYTLLGAVVVLLLLLVYLLVIEPWQQQTTQLRNSVAAQQETLQWMRMAAQEIEHLQRSSGKKADAGQSLMGVIDASTRQAGLAQSVRQLRPDEQGVSVRLENAVFDDMLRWLSRLYGQHGIAVTHFTMERLSQPGRVNASVMLSGGEQ